MLGSIRKIPNINIDVLVVEFDSTDRIKNFVRVICTCVTIHGHPYNKQYFLSCVIGDPTKASPAQGRRINEYIINGLVELIKQNI